MLRLLSELTGKHRCKDTLRARNLQLDTALNNMNQGLCMFDGNARLILCNDRYIEMYKLSRAVVKPGCTLRAMLDHRRDSGTFSGDPDRYVIDLRAQLARGQTVNVTVELADGRVIAIVNSLMEAGGWVATHEDITERRRAERERDRNQAFLDLVVENVPAAIYVKDARDLRYVLINRAGQESFGLSADQMIGKTAYDLLPPSFADGITAHDRHTLQSLTPDFQEEHPIEMPSKGARIVTSTRVPILDPNGRPQYLLTVVHDVTERRRAEARIAHLAHHDPLTDLPNRAAFNERLSAMLETAWGTGQSFAVMCLDLDRFKDVNDVFGHSSGDALLCAAARRLQANAQGAFLARFGGDEFMLLVNDGAQPAAAAAIADRLVAALANDFDIGGQKLRVGLSVGVAIYPAHGADAMRLLSNSDAALYRAKAEGRGTVRFFESAMDAELRERRALQRDLQSALARNELVLHYQPQASIDGTIVGFEALVRWRHPTRGLIAPTTFIPIAEDSGLIIPIGEWVLRTACREAASWPSDLSVAINLSPVQFRHGDLPALVHSALLATSLAPSRLELEVTESVLIGDFPRALSVLRRLKALGIRIAMDDFGAGYSSLSYLQSFPFDKIKIDRAFIANLERNPQSSAIVRAVIGLGRGLDLPVIAEGVETEDQRSFLLHEACSAIQGFLIGRPLPMEHYARLVGRGPQNDSDPDGEVSSRTIRPTSSGYRAGASMQPS
jgi:diguanylate cyclase (GGDEF)-like protein/PAS domain S-box-containing protein